jgi:hypothetical protein
MAGRGIFPVTFRSYSGKTKRDDLMLFYRADNPVSVILPEQRRVLPPDVPAPDKHPAAHETYTTDRDECSGGEREAGVRFRRNCIEFFLNYPLSMSGFISSQPRDLSEKKSG